MIKNDKEMYEKCEELMTEIDKKDPSIMEEGRKAITKTFKKEGLKLSKRSLQGFCLGYGAAMSNENYEAQKPDIVLLAIVNRMKNEILL